MTLMPEVPRLWLHAYVRVCSTELQLQPCTNFFNCFKYGFFRQVMALISVLRPFNKITQLRPEGPEKTFWRLVPPPLSKGLDDCLTPPPPPPPPPLPYLKVWTRHCKISGGFRGGARGTRAPLIFGPKWGPKVWKQLLLDPPPPPYLRGWMTGPPPDVKVGIRQWKAKLRRTDL